MRERERRGGGWRPQACPLSLLLLQILFKAVACRSRQRRALQLQPWTDTLECVYLLLKGLAPLQAAGIMDRIGVSFQDPLDEYELIHRIGCGTYGEVFKVSVKSSSSVGQGEHNI